MSKILITGGSGLLALNWAYKMRHQHEIMLGLHSKKVNLDGVDTSFIDISSVENCVNNILKLSPDIVINTAGYTNVNACESNQAEALNVNAKLAGYIATACHKTKTKMIHISTDHLFSGEVACATEEMVANPLNVYGQTKLLGEQTVLQENPSALVIRTNFFGWGHQFRQSFSDWIYNSAVAKDKITLFDDVYYTPILIDALIDYTHQLLNIDESGIINIVSDNRISKHDFGILLCKTFNLSSDFISRGKFSSEQFHVKRPKDMSLSNSKLKKTLCITDIPLLEQLKLLKMQLEDGRYEEFKKAVMEI